MQKPKTRQIIHVDMDAFFASVEQLDNPRLKDKPVIVGGNPKGRGVVSAASYKARKFGVHSAMPMAKAIRLCPDAIVLPVRMSRYVELSQQIHTIFQQFTPIIEPISLDEAFLDVTDSIPLFESAEKIGREIKKTVANQIHLVASVGIASNKFLAKLASDLDKPDGFVIITRQNTQKILDPLPISKIWGVGKVTQKTLHAKGIHTIHQLRNYPLDSLRAIVGNYADTLLDLARGIDDRPVEPQTQAKSISTENTFAQDVDDKEILLDVLLEQTEEVAQKLRAAGLKTKTLSLKLRYADFRTITRAKTLTHPTNTTDTLWQTAKTIFEQWYAKYAAPLRLIGFAASKLRSENAGQLELFTDTKEIKQKNLDKTIDKIRKKFGNNALKRKGRSKN